MDQTILNRQPSGTAAGTWSRVVRLIEAHPDVKQVRLNINEHSVSVGFYETPSEETLNDIKAAVRAGLSRGWDVSIEPDDNSPTIHLHKIDNYTTEFHRAHPADEPPVIWKRIPLPMWRNRPFPRPVPRDYRVMLVLAAICGLSTFIGFLLGRAGIRGELVAPFLAVAYVSGGWFATQDVWHALSAWRAFRQGMDRRRDAAVSVFVEQRAGAVRKLSHTKINRVVAQSRAETRIST